MSTDNPNEVLPNNELLQLAEGVPPVSVDASVRARMKQQILNRIDDGCPVGGKTVRGEKQAWYELNDRIAIKVLHQDKECNIQSALWRLKPGAIISGHKHRSDEECLVIEGSIQVDNHILFAGDYHRMEQGSVHDDIYTKDGALLFLRHDMHKQASDA